MIDLFDQIEKTLAPRKISVIEFAESSEYCNKPLYPRQEVLLKIFFLEELAGWEEDVLTHWLNGGRNGTEITISPNIRERMEYLRENGYKHFREIVLAGGRRSSKGFITGVSMAKVMWDCLQLEDPGTFYGIDPTKDIYFSCVAGSEDQAKQFQYADFSSSVETCKAFEPYIVKGLETEIRVATEVDLRRITQARMAGNKIQKDIARLRGNALAANAGTLRGSATMGIVIDEMAHMIPGESKASAEQVYTAADPSLDQFGRDGIMFCNSSPLTKVGMFFERYTAAMRPFDPTRPIEFGKVDPESEDDDSGKNGDPRIVAFQYPSWALFEGYQGSKHKFRRAITVSPDWDPDEKLPSGEYLWSEDDRRDILTARSKEADNPETYKVERRGKFAEVSEAYLNPQKVDAMYEGTPKEWVFHAGSNVPVLRCEPYKTNWGTGALNRFMYKIHVDPSSTTAGFGFALGHREIFTDWLGKEESHVVFDIIKRWQPKNFSGGAIHWDTVLDEIYLYAELFRPFEITFDQHQSAEPIQRLQQRLLEKNINCRVREIVATNEINWKRWEVFKTALYRGWVHAPSDTADIEWSKLELKYLQEVKTGGKHPKVDRQEIGPVQTKDMADCIAEVTYSLIGNMFIDQARERLANSVVVGGSPGGYGIGNGGLPTGGSGPPNISEYYSRRDEKEARMGMGNPARGVVGRGRGRKGGSRSRGW